MDHLTTLAGLVEDRRWVLVTSPGWVGRGILKPLEHAVGRPAAVISDVPTNPRISDVVRLASRTPDVDLLIALGGGSVIDTTKGIAALKGLQGDEPAFLSHLQAGVPLPASLVTIPTLAVPTTSGTGSEVTRWATIWGETGAKHSLSHPDLVPRAAVLDPFLCVSLPEQTTIASGLDAASHAMEAIWNRNHSAITDALAVAALRILRADLAAAVKTPADVQVRSRIQIAALMAGLAMGTTQTALAHSISYPFTSRFGVPHGLACSFTLGEVAAFNLETAPERVAVLVQAFGCSVERLVHEIYRWLGAFDVGARVHEYFDVAAIADLAGDLITPARAANNIRDVDGPTASRIAIRALQRLGENRQ